MKQLIKLIYIILGIDDGVRLENAFVHSMHIDDVIDHKNKGQNSSSLRYLNLNPYKKPQQIIISHGI